MTVKCKFIRTERASVSSSCQAKFVLGSTLGVDQLHFVVADSGKFELIRDLG